MGSVVLIALSLEIVSNFFSSLYPGKFCKPKFSGRSNLYQVLGRDVITVRKEAYHLRCENSNMAL